MKLSLVALLLGASTAWGGQGGPAENCAACDHDWARAATPASVQAMFDSGTSPNGLSRFNSPLIFLIAFVNPDPAVAKRFLKEAEARDEELHWVTNHRLGFVESTVLHYAARNKSPAMLEYFLASGADTTLRDAREKTPLHVAAGYSEDSKTYLLLLEAGIDPNARDALGWTALHTAVRFSKNKEIFRVLARHGADLNARTDNGRTPLWIAENYREAWLVDLLRSLGAR